MMFCPACSIALPATAKWCTRCGGIATLSSGTAVANPPTRYTVQTVLGIGGMGIVYSATETGSARHVVVKELYVDDPALLADAQRRFRREAEIQAAITHPAFPAGYGYFQDQNREFMAMEFVPGQDLEKILGGKPAGRMSEDEVLEMGIQICDGLTVLHNFVDPVTNRPEPLLHRDIKPANVILRPTGQICILDLGIARQVNQSQQTKARMTRAGTFEYASPQQVSGTGMSVRDDVYSLAATLFHLLTGNAFIGDFTQRAAEIDALPQAWQPIFRRAIQNDSGLRHRSAEEFKNDLIKLLPPHLQPAAGPAQPAPAVTTVPVDIVWRPARTAMINPGEYRKLVAGRVMQGNVPLAGVDIVPTLFDTGGGLAGTPGTRLTSGQHGDFTLAVLDITVPVNITAREIQLVVEDPNTGDELCRTNVVIKRPWVWRRARKKAAAAAGAARQGAAAAVGAARHIAGAPFRGMGHAGRAFGHGVANAASGLLAAATSWQLLIGIAVLLLAATFAGAALQKRWDWLIWIWPHCLIGAIAFAYFGWKLRTRSFGQVLKRAFAVNFLVILWVMGWLGYILR